MLKSTLLAASLGALMLGACSAAAHEPVGAAQVASAAPATCDIRAIRTAHGVRFEASARARAAMSGEYELVVTKIGPEGDSDIVQGGAFDTRGFETVRLSGAEISLEPRSRFRARLTLSEFGDDICFDEVRS